MKKLLFILVVGFMILPSLSLAQTSRFVTDPVIPPSCVSISNNLSYRSRDISTNGAVSVLQTFLNSKGYLNSEPTGYFGPLTLSATKAFQSANGVLNSGYVGPITQAKIRSLTCGTTVVPPKSIVISEQVQCIFNGTTTEQKCNGIGSYTSYNGAELFPPQFSCSGIGSCVAKIKISDIAKGMKVIWSSSCVVNKSPVTTIDGNDEYANFNCGTGSNLPPITVLNPNGGENWQKGTTQTIKWLSYTPAVNCPVGASCFLPPPKFYDIKLDPYYKPCSGSACPMYPYITYAIAKNIGGLSYDWSVGSVALVGDTSSLPPDGLYSIQVCQSGTNICDSSDSYFKIFSK